MTVIQNGLRLVSCEHTIFASSLPSALFPPSASLPGTTCGKELLDAVFGHDRRAMRGGPREPLGAPARKPPHLLFLLFAQVASCTSQVPRSRGGDISAVPLCLLRRASVLKGLLAASLPRPSSGSVVRRPSAPSRGVATSADDASASGDQCHRLIRHCFPWQPMEPREQSRPTSSALDHTCSSGGWVGGREPPMKPIQAAKKTSNKLTTFPKS